MGEETIFGNIGVFILNKAFSLDYTDMYRV